MRCESAFYVNQYQVPTLHGLCSLFFCCSQSPLSAIVCPLPCLSPLSFPVTGNSHNCWPKRLSVSQEAARISLAEAEGSVPGGVGQDAVWCTSEVRHTQQTGGQEPEYGHHWSWVFEAGSSGRMAERQLLRNQGGLSGVSRSWFQSAACNSLKGRRTVLMTSRFEWVIVKDLKSGSRRLMR